MLQEWGDIISYSEPLNDSQSFLLHMVQTETSSINEIDHTGWVKLEVKLFNYRLLEKELEHRRKQPASIPFTEISLHSHSLASSFYSKGTISPLSTKSTSSPRSEEICPTSLGSFSSLSTIQDPAVEVAPSQEKYHGCFPCDHPSNTNKSSSTKKNRKPL